MMGARTCSRPFLLPLLLCLCGLATAAETTSRADIQALQPISAAAPQSDGSAQTMTFRQLGARYPLQLRGVEGRNGVAFSVRSDRVVTAAEVDLAYSYSPALLPGLSQVNVLINEEIVASLPVVREKGGVMQRQRISIPPHLVTEFNRLNVQLIGHYTMECEDPGHSSLWATVSNTSELRLVTQPLAQQNDLTQLPGPFFDRRDVRRLDLPFVFAARPDAGYLEAAGTLSSWFGSLADYRGAAFRVSQGVIPTSGNAVVILRGGDKVAGLDTTGVAGPTISVVENPNDPYGKLLLVMGRNSEELKTAAVALALGADALSGDRATIQDFVQIEPRRPYDAPKWLPSNGPVPLGALVAPEVLNVAGYAPDTVRVPLRVPPDLFGWDEKGVPLDLRFRYTRPQTDDRSSLNIEVSGQLVATLPLRPQRTQDNQVTRALARIAPGDPLSSTTERMYLPMYMLPALAELQFRFEYPMPGSDCALPPPNNVRAVIEPDSTVDISGLKHFKAMPDLAAFGTAGYPFTRMADLSGTAFVLPRNPGEVDYAIYLTLMGRMGAATGYPATAVSVVQGDDVASVADKDLLVLSSAENQPLTALWAEHLPFAQQGDARVFRISDLVRRAAGWFAPNLVDRSVPDRVQLGFSSRADDVVLTGFESPLAKGRSVVLLSGSEPEVLYNALGALMDSDKDLVSQIQGSLVVVRGDKVSTLAAEQSYFVGELDPVTHVRWYLAQRPLLMVALGILAATILGSVFFLSLRSRARRRLGETHEDDRT